jgi:signal transduction histidine kinase
MDTPTTATAAGPPSSRTWFWASMSIAGAGVLLGIAFILGILPEDTTFWASNTGYPIVSIAAGFVLAAAAFTMVGRARWAWFIIGVGVAFWGFGEAIWSVYTVVLEQEVPYPGWADVFYVAGYPTILIGIFLLPHVKAGRFERLRITLDAVAGAIAVSAISWITFLRDNIWFDPELSFLEQWINILYPVGDVVILIAVIILAVRRSEYRFDGRLLVLGIALVVTAVADVIYLFQYETYVDGAWLDGIYMFGYAAFSVIGYLVTRPMNLVDSAYRPPQIWQLAVPYAAILTLLTLSLAEIRETASVLQLASGLVVILVVARQAVSIRETRELVEKQRDDLVASVSHELRTPLTSIQGFAQLLDEHWSQVPDKQKHELIETINQQAKHLGNITTDLVEVTRDRLHTTQVDPEEIDLAELIDGAVAMVGDLANGSVEITSEVPAGIAVMVDAQRMTQVFINLLTNGCRYGDSRIHIDSRLTDGTVTVTVEDDGPGVPRKYEAVIWERFERGAHRFDTVTPGSGIGLPIAKALVEAHHGSIEYEPSDALGGASFVVKLPVSRAMDPVPA